MEDEELDSLKLPSRLTIELSQFVDADDIAPLYFNRPYHVLPDGEAAEEAWRVLRDAPAARRKLGVGQLTLRGREHLVALLPIGGGQGLALDTLCYDRDLKNADEIFSGLGRDKPRADMLQMAFVAPQLGETATQPPSGAQWIFEIKYDGYRLEVATGREGARRLYAQWSRLDRALSRPLARRLHAALPQCAARWRNVGLRREGAFGFRRAGLGRQGRACRAAARRIAALCGNGDLRLRLRARPRAGRAETLRRDDQQGAPARSHLHRLAAQQAHGHRHSALVAAGAARRPRGCPALLAIARHRGQPARLSTWPPRAR